MATFTMVIKSNAGGPGKPYSENAIDDPCLTSVDIIVPVPAGQNRYVETSYTGTADHPAPLSGNITSDTTYTIYLDSRRSATPSQNTESSEGTIEVSITSSDPVFYTKQILRQHELNVNC